MTAVTIRGTFSKDERPSNGLEEIADDLLGDQFGTHYVVGVVQFAGSNRPGPGEHEIPAVKFLGIEPLTGDTADQAKAILDATRKARGLGHVDDLIKKGAEAAAAALAQDTLPGLDGEVPEASGEELMAERAEEKAAAGVGDPFTP